MELSESVHPLDRSTKIVRKLLPTLIPHNCHQLIAQSPPITFTPIRVSTGVNVQVPAHHDMSRKRITTDTNHITAIYI